MFKKSLKLHSLPLTQREPAALYIHIPFCARRCPYCDFAVSEKRHALENKYIEALRKEACRLPQAFQPRTIFIGGGTPTELTPQSLELVGQIVARHSRELKEFTIEANPGTLTQKKLATLRKIGVTRVSLGSQSLQDSVLNTLGRFHTADQTRTTVAMLRDHGFHNLNLDLIFGVPGQSLDDLKRDLDLYLSLDLPHISAYGLTYEEGTPFFTHKESGQLKAIPQDLEAKMFHEIRRQLIGSGYIHYEISNYARPGFPCSHNRVYWRNGSYHGLGNSAASHLKGRRRVNARSVDEYIESVMKSGGALKEDDRLDGPGKIRETAYLALRTARGLDTEVFRRDLTIDVFEWFKDPIAKHLESGMLETFGTAVRLSAKGLALADTIAMDFL
jgi:oxygen-independent coproporphyrinogen III oxidase